jgi:hypothetical protein
MGLFSLFIRLLARAISCRRLPENLDAVLRKYGKIRMVVDLAPTVAALSVRTLGNTSILALQSMAGAIGGPREQSPLGSRPLAWYVGSGLLSASISAVTLYCDSVSPAAVSGRRERAGRGGSDGADLLCGASASIVAALALKAAGVLGSIVYRAIAA